MDKTRESPITAGSQVLYQPATRKRWQPAVVSKCFEGRGAVYYRVTVAGRFRHAVPMQLKTIVDK